MDSEGTRTSTFEDSKHISSILKILHNQRPHAKLCDVILKVSGETIYAHSNVLCAASPYFDALFCGGQDMPRAFSQKSPQIIEIHIDGDEKDGYIEAVQKIVDFMYTSVIVITPAVLSQIVEIAKIMQMENILEFCSQFQHGSKGNIPRYELHRLGSELMSHTVGTKDTMVQTEPVGDDLFSQRSPVKKQKTETEHSSEGENSLHAMTDGEKDENSKAENRLPAKRRRGRPRKDSTAGGDKIKIKKEVPKLADADEKPKVIQLMAPQVTPSIQAVRVSARVRERILTGKYRDFSDIIENKTNDTELDTAKSSIPDITVKENVESISRVVYQCGMCSHVSTSIENFNAHQAVHQASKKYVCDVCDFSTSKTKHFHQHKREHMHAENHCSFCGWICEDSEPNSPAFQAHLAKHKGPEPYFCTVCDLRFKTRTKLQLHTPKHSKIKPFVCEQCGAGFKWKHALKNHMIVHKNTKDYLCDFCGFSTAHKSQMTSHRLIHTGETFKCSEPGCSFIATKRNYLRYHMLTHTHEKPHQCEVCGQSFSLIKNMKRHMLLHSSKRDFMCEKCSFSTTRFDKLKEHYWKQHNIGAPPGKKFRLKDYLEVNPAKETEPLEGVSVVAGYVDNSEVPVGETQTFELQIEDAGVIDDGSTSVTYLESSGGEPIPVAIRSITQVTADNQLTEVQYADVETGALQTLYVTQVEMEAS